jgi:hypothetical protein
MCWLARELFPTAEEIEDAKRQPGYAAEECATLEEIALSYPRVD